MTHERQTMVGDLTYYIDSCRHCPYMDEQTIFKSVIDERYDKVQKICKRQHIILKNIDMIPIECDLPPRYRM